MSKREIAYHFFICIFVSSDGAFFLLYASRDTKHVENRVVCFVFFLAAGELFFLKCMRDTVETSADGTK